MSLLFSPKSQGHILDHHPQVNKIIASLAEEGSGGMVPLPLRNLAAGEKTPFNVYLKVKTKDHPKPQFALCCSQGQVFKREWHEKLAQLNIFWGYFELEEEETVFQYLSDHLEHALEDDSRDNLEKAGLIYDVTLIHTRRLFTEIKERANLQLDLALPLIDRLFHLVKREHYWDLIAGIMRSDQSLYSHSLNVCLLGLAFVGYLGWRARDAQIFGVGALLHDLGMSSIPREIVQKEGPLTADELEKIRHHPTLGFRLLKNHACLLRDPLLMVLQHHENCDGTGYPQSLGLEDIYPWARILRIVDSYEAMTAPRPWRGILSPQEALWNIREGLEEQRIYDPYYFVAFVKFLSENKEKQLRGNPT